MAKIDNWKKWQKILFITGIYAGLSLVISFGLLSYLNGHMYIKDDSAESTSASVVSTPAPSPENSVDQPSLITGVPEDNANLMFSFDNQYCVYLFENKLYVKEIISDKLLRTIEEDKYPITNAILMNDRNIVIYFGIDSANSVHVKTFNIDTNAVTEESSFKVAAGSSIKKTDYSSLTNLIYINVGRSWKNSELDRVYYLNIVKKLSVSPTASTVDNMVLLGNTRDLYYQNGRNQLYHNDSTVKSLKGKKIDLLGKDSKDNIYVQLLSDRKTIYVLNKDAIVKTITLDNPDYLNIYADKSSIYTIYDNYFTDISADPSAKIPYNRNTDLLGIVGDKLYLRSTTGEIIQFNASQNH